MNTLKSSLLSFFALLACATSPSVDATPDHAGIDALMAAHDAAWNAHDPAALASLTVENATVVTPMGRRVEGRPALLEMFASPGPTKQTQSSTHIDGVQVLAADLVLIDATQTLTGPGTAQLRGTEAQLVAVARRVDGEWRLEAARPFPKPSSAPRVSGE